MIPRDAQDFINTLPATLSASDRRAWISSLCTTYPDHADEIAKAAEAKGVTVEFAQNAAKDEPLE